MSEMGEICTNKMCSKIILSVRDNCEFELLIHFFRKFTEIRASSMSKYLK